MPIDIQDWKRLEEIQDKIGDLLEEAKDLVRMSGNRFEYERAKGYWIAYIDNAIDQPKSPLLPCTMGDTLVALKPQGIDDDEDDEEYDEDEEAVSNSPG